jgi:hypothetical protein
MADSSYEVEVSPTLQQVWIPNLNFGNMAKRYMSSFVVQVGDVISMMDNLRLRAKTNIQLQVNSFSNTDVVGKLTVSYWEGCDVLNLSTDNNLHINSCQEIKLKAGDAIEFQPSGNCKTLGVCSNECEIKMWATDKLLIKSEGSILFEPSDYCEKLGIYSDGNSITTFATTDLNVNACGNINIAPENVINLENDTNVTDGYDISFLNSGSAINFSDSSYITTAGSRVISCGGDRTIQFSDNGQTLWMYQGYTVYVPLNSDLALPIGTRVSIASGGNTVYITRTNSSVTIVGNEYGSYGGSAASWYIPAYFIAEIIKIDTNYWLLSGPRLFVND